jgi:uncharacterized Ntn-hydrolase superfamily protein
METVAAFSATSCCRYAKTVIGKRFFFIGNIQTMEQKIRKTIYLLSELMNGDFHVALV